MSEIKLPEKFKERMKAMLGASYADFIASYDNATSRGLHINTIKCGENELNGFGLSPLLDNCKYVRETKPGKNSSGVGKMRFRAEGSVQKVHDRSAGSGFHAAHEEFVQFGLGAHPYHAAGLYYMQEPSAMMPALAFDMPKGARVLDMCAAPGGKTSQLGIALGGEGLLVANEYDRSRANVLKENVTRMGYTNVAVVNMFPARLAETLRGYFDVVVVDAPCSGEGMFRKNPDAVREWSVGQTEACARRQAEIVLSAAACLKTGGLLVYSTCTFSEDEDEDIVRYILTLGFDLLPVKKEVAVLGIDTGLGVKFFPHIFGEGQFTAVCVKTAHESPCVVKSSYRASARPQTDALSKIIDTSGLEIAVYGDILYSPLSLPAPFDFGVKLGKTEKDGRVTPAHNLFTAFGSRARNFVEVSEDEARAYMRGEELSAASENGWGCIKINGHPLGGYKASSNSLKNHYPKGLRLS